MSDDAEPWSMQRAWEDLKYAVALVVSAFGEPARIVAMGYIHRQTRQHILEWLAPVEALVRRILLLAALKAPTPNLAPLPKREPPVRSALRDDQWRAPSENPADWRVIFSVWPRTPSAPPQTRCEVSYNPGESAGARDNAVPLARRLEALLRIARDPSAALARMVRMLALRRAHAPYAFAPYRHPARAIATILRETQDAVDAALWNTS